MKNFRSKFFLSAAIWGCALTFVSSVRADGGNPSDYLHSRTYIGFVGTSVSVNNGGLFNGQNYSRTNYLSSPSSSVTIPPYEIDIIPSLAQNFGFGLLVGHREEAYAAELSYWQSNHVASFGPASVTSSSVTTPTIIGLSQDTAVYYSLNLDFKRYFLTETQIQPFINLGVCFPWIVVSNAASDPSGNLGNLTLAGLGLNLGIGVEYYLTPNISFTGGGYQRWASFDQSKSSVSNSTQFSPLVINGNAASDDGSGLVFLVGTTIGFQ